MGRAAVSEKIGGAGVRLTGVGRTYGNGTIALDRIDLRAAPGEFLAILGPSGCGKSTLLRLVAGLDLPQSGTVETDATRGGIAYVFQDAHLLPWRNVLRNVALPLELRHVDRPARLAAARAAIEQVGLADAIDRYPAQLSGGMRMRVSLARAMVTRPRLLLLDEPFAALDEITRQRLDAQLRELWIESGMTVLFVTHSSAEAVFLAERAVVMSARPGRIIADHAIDLPQQRDALMRASPQFAQNVRALALALEGSGA